nr:sensor domain-containing diguanylate cyclase [Pseudazoarcus pumilus]
MADAPTEFEHSLIKAIHEASPDGILVVDEQDRVVSYNQRFLAIFGLNLTELHDPDVDGPLHDDALLSGALQAIRDPEAFLQRVRALYADPTIHDVTEIELVDGRTLERHSTALWTDDRRYLGRVWFFRDITDRKCHEQLLEAQSRRDPLTGVANRRGFFNRAGEAFARARRSGLALSVIMLDIDLFKGINDRYGHAAGDQVLRHLCRVAASVVRETDLFARIGGEEFVVLAPDTDHNGCADESATVARISATSGSPTTSAPAWRPSRPATTRPTRFSNVPTGPSTRPSAPGATGS